MKKIKQEIQGDASAMREVKRLRGEIEKWALHDAAQLARWGEEEARCWSQVKNLREEVADQRKEIDRLLAENSRLQSISK